MAERKHEERREELVAAFGEEPERKGPERETGREAREGSREEMGHEAKRESIDAEHVERTTAGMPEERPQAKMAEPDESKR